ncbi:hypothetical protein EVAR_101114_1 [Eumeta japonica]|uniref:Uncharacterized protein n=1 Tax=Eumeta variegata TaxID=151549 RepID=A0A4C2A4B8_EUMVA|nr:hypothetical protein EVAR_101114_1 [Eumeta japonica]
MVGKNHRSSRVIKTVVFQPKVPGLIPTTVKSTIDTSNISHQRSDWDYKRRRLNDEILHADDDNRRAAVYGAAVTQTTRKTDGRSRCTRPTRCTR